MTSTTQFLAPHRPVRRGIRRRLAVAVARLYADRPILASTRPGDGGRLPGRPYADLPTL